MGTKEPGSAQSSQQLDTNRGLSRDTAAWYGWNISSEKFKSSRLQAEGYVVHVQTALTAG